MRHSAFLAMLALSLGPRCAEAADEAHPPAQKPQPGAGPSSAEVFPPGALQPDDGLTTPPPGSPEDQALWKASVRMNNALPTQRAEAARLQWRAKSSRLDERLGALARKGTPEEGQRAEALRRKLQGAMERDYETLVRRWPVDPTRVCRYPELDFTSALNAGKGPDERAQQAQARSSLRKCLDNAQLVLRVLEDANGQLASAISDAEAIVPPVQQPTAEGSPPPAQLPAPPATGAPPGAGKN